jgi:hypothetical protein
MGGGEKIIREKIKKPLNYLRALLFIERAY